MSDIRVPFTFINGPRLVRFRTVDRRDDAAISYELAINPEYVSSVIAWPAVDGVGVTIAMSNALAFYVPGDTVESALVKLGAS